MRCEVCGRKILGKPLKATIEGAKMVVCGNCAKLGKVYLEATPSLTPRKRKITRHPLPMFSVKKHPPKVTETFELIDNFSLQIRQAREKLGLSHKDLGRKIGEKVSVLRKIETGKMTPNHQLAEKLEHALRIRLLVPPSEPKIPQSTLSKPPEITLGKIVHLKKRKTETAKE
jgi:putative transcription factor